MAVKKSSTKSTTTATAEGAVADSLEVVENKAKLLDTDEIEVVSLIPNVTYKDNRTGDFYEWEEIGHVEIMTVESLKNLWRNHKTYFRQLWLKPKDDRVIKQFGLNKFYENYEYLMKESSYTKENIKEVINKIKELPNGVKYTVCNLIKSGVYSGTISDVYIIKSLEDELNIGLFSLIKS